MAKIEADLTTEKTNTKNKAKEDEAFQQHRALEAKGPADEIEAANQASVPDVLPNIFPPFQIHLLAGAPGVGKTGFTFWMLKQIQEEKEIFGIKATRPEFMGFLASDRSWDSHQKWADVVGLGDIAHYSVVDSTEVALDKLDDKKVGKHTELFKTLLKKIHPEEAPPRGSFFIVDPISLFIGGDINKYIPVFRHMVEINQMLREEGWTLLGMAHAGKQKTNKEERYLRPQDRIAGTTALLGCAGTAMYLAGAEETESGDPEFSWVPHHAPAATFSLHRIPETGLLVPGGTKAEQRLTATGRAGVKISKSMQGMLELFPADEDGEKLSVVLQKAVGELGIAQATTYRYKEQLKLAGAIQETGKRGWYRRVEVRGD